MRARLKPSTWDSYRRNLDLHVLPALGDLPLDEVTVRGLNALYGLLLTSGRRNGPGGLSPKTIRYIHTILHGALADAVDLGLLQANPADRAKAPRAGNGSVREMQVWTAAQLQAFLRFLEQDRLYAAIHLAAMTGMRRGEVLGLRWKDLDLAARRLAIRHTLISVAYEIQESTPKTHRARVVDLDPGTCAVLRCHQDKTAGEGVHAMAGLVFTREDGRPVHPDLFTQRFDRLVARSGLPRIRLHDLRHTHATLGLSAGVPVRVMSERLGHQSPEFTLHQYAHVLPGMQAAAAEQIADLVNDAA